MLTVDLQDFPLAYSPKLPARTRSLSRLINFSTLDQSISQGHRSSPQSCQLHLGRTGRSSHIILITTYSLPSRDVLSHSAEGPSPKSTRLHAMVVVWSLLVFFFFAGLLWTQKQIMKRTKGWRPWGGRGRREHRESALLVPRACSPYPRSHHYNDISSRIIRIASHDKRPRSVHMGAHIPATNQVFIIVFARLQCVLALFAACFTPFVRCTWQSKLHLYFFPLPP